MNLKLPAYTNPCLAPSFHSNSSRLIFLFGVPDGTLTLVSHMVDITHIDAPKVEYISSNFKTDPLFQWSSTAEKNCFANPSSSINLAVTSTKVLQLGMYSSGALLLPTNELRQAFDIPTIQYKSSKLFAATQVRGLDDYTVAWGIVASSNPVCGTRTAKEGWIGVLRNTISITIATQGFDSLPSKAPMLAVGAYSTTTTSGVIAVFGKDSVGSLYSASNVINDAGTNAPISWIFAGPKQPIDNEGAILTPDAVPISAQNVAYILDQASDNLTIVYALRPSISNKLVKVATKGDLPPFNKNMVGTALSESTGDNGRIAVYSLDKATGAARFNLFDTFTGIWTGSGLAVLLLRCVFW
ncbi:hypothetical protein BGZ47_008097 [Haplosporangium gracile]|nr:hypothetical protein BGZ47_008097 [Haplosporangium gracile]